MAYEYEREEWRSALAATSYTEQERQRDAQRRALGITGDPTDALDDNPDATPDEAA